MIEGLGIELVEISPFDVMAASNQRSHLESTFTLTELEYCLGKRQAGEHLAVRYAAKLATLKALGQDVSSEEHIKAVEIVRTPSGQPRLELSEPVRSAAGRQGITSLHVSLSHSGGFAVGMVVLERGSTGETP